MDRATVARRTNGGPRTGENTVIRLRNALACAQCPARELGLCGGFDSAGALGGAENDASDDAFHRSPAQGQILHHNEAAESTSIICSGWAVSALALPDGRRQIVSVLLSGDPFPPTGFFEPEPGRSVEAVTNVIYRTFQMSDVKSLLYSKPHLFFKISGFFVQQRDASDQLALDLGRRGAEQRIANMILRLRERLLPRGLADRTTMEFPLRQNQIADATGLTPTDVDRVMEKFARLNLIRMIGRSLVLLDLTALKHIADEADATGHAI